MNKYYEKIKFVKSEIVSYLTEILSKYDYELPLYLGDCNLLQSEKNCIESSTATGYLLEEFVASKLETYTENHDNINKIKVERTREHGTQNTSYDCYVNYDGVRFLINAKAEKGSNNAIAAINILHEDYVENCPAQEKSFLVLKTKYRFDKSAKTDENVIRIDGFDIYALEEVDFSSGHKQDHRNWSQEFKSSSGRLQVSKKFRKDHKVAEEDVSYQQTKGFIEKIYQG